MKPEILYHGSCKGISGPLTPRLQHGDENGKFPNGPQNLVFATNEYKYAALYALKTKDMLSCGNGNEVSFSVLRDIDQWKKDLQNSTCAVYELPSDTFEPTINNITGKPGAEWKSRNAVSPTGIIRQTPESVMALGNQLFFLDKAITKEMWQYDQDGNPEVTFQNRVMAKYKTGQLPKDFSPLNLMRECVDAGFMRHLNRDEGIAPIELPKSPHAAIIAEDIEWLKSRMRDNQLNEAIGNALISYRDDWRINPRNQKGRITNIARSQ